MYSCRPSSLVTSIGSPYFFTILHDMSDLYSDMLLNPLEVI